MVRSYDEELARLSHLIARMGGLAEAQFGDALSALVRRDSTLASQVIASDTQLDGLEQEVHAFTVRLLALRQPVAQDLRVIVAALKVSSELERIGDYATNVAKRALVLNQMPPVGFTSGIQRLGRLVQDMLKQVLDAYVALDVEKALNAWKRDEEVDSMYTSLFREMITYTIEDPRNITACIHLMFISKNIERVGDHATNIAETVHFTVRGTPLVEARPKGESVPSPAINPEER
jgi:phosphate transport system protein